MSLKGMVSIFNKAHFWLVRLIQERQMVVIITKYNKYLKVYMYIYIYREREREREREILTSLKSKPILEVLFALISVNKDLE